MLYRVLAEADIQARKSLSVVTLNPKLIQIMALSLPPHEAKAMKTYMKPKTG